MLTRIQVTNFRGFRSLDAEVAAVTAFLGPNSSGKTTVLHAVRLACDALRLALESGSTPQVGTKEDYGWIVVTGGTLIGNHTRLLPLADWRALFVDQDVGEGVRLSIQLTFQESDSIQAIWIELVCARNEQLKLGVWVEASEALQLVAGLGRRSALVNQRLAAFLRDHAPVAVFVPPFYGTVREEEYRARVVLDRLLGSGDQSHVVRNLVGALNTAQFEQLNAFLQSTVGATLTYRTSGDATQTEFPMRVRFKDSNGDIELSAAGAGLVNLIALFSSLSRWQAESAQRRVLFLLDEPEAHLHPKLQAESAERLSRLVTQDFGAQLLVATHSVDILNRLSTTGARLLRCDRAAQPAIVALDSDSKLFDDLAAWADLTPYTAINFLASRRVVFCEGDDDQAVLTRLAEVRFRNDPVRWQKFRQWALVQLKGASNQPVSSLLSRLVRNDVVKARAQSGGGFNIIVVLDRDHARTPGVTPTTQDGVSETTVIWSRHSLESILLEAPVLNTWIRALVGDAAPPDLPSHIEAALSAADADEKLNTFAVDQLTAKLATSDFRDKNGKHLGGEQKIIHAVREARERVASQPAVWQRGKDRAQFILGRIRPLIDLPARNQFPTDIVRLLERAEINRIGDLQAAVPAEIGALLDRLVST